MKKCLLLCLAAACLFSCKEKAPAPRPAVALVDAVLRDTSGMRRLAAEAGKLGNGGSIAIIGEPSDVLFLSREFALSDLRDNIDGRMRPDSLPDFAGEKFDLLLDAEDAPYDHFLENVGGSDSLRSLAVQNALFAWDSTCVRSSLDTKALLHKSRSKLLIYTSSLQAEYGLFDLDTLQQLAGGACPVISPAVLQIQKALDSGATHIAVWTSREVRDAGAWQAVFERMAPEGATLAVIAPEQALDVRTRLRGLLRQYLATGRRMDALILDHYGLPLAPLNSEISLIRRIGTEEDASFDRILAQDFLLLDPSAVLLDATYALLREKDLFAHRIARPVLGYYETFEAEDGNTLLLEVGPEYVAETYVHQID